ncbi:MAG: hypothetical protein DMG65_15640, partial [Candidatus Angelobacter sp. Gp1-AA117]
AIPENGISGVVGFNTAQLPVHANDKKFSGEPDAGNLHVGFDEGRVGRTTVLPSLLLYRLTSRSQTLSSVPFVKPLCPLWLAFGCGFATL